MEWNLRKINGDKNVWESVASIYYEEELVLPQELFTHEKGVILLSFNGFKHYPYVRNYPYGQPTDQEAIVVDSTYDTGIEPERIASAIAFYEVHGDTVILHSN